MIMRFAVVALLVCAGCAATADVDSGEGASVEFVAFERTDDDLLALFRLENNGSAPIEFFGTDGHLPSIELQGWRDGEWKRSRFAWCTDGYEWLPLGPGESVTLDVRRVREELPLRLGITVRAGGEPEQVWSERVER
jgi:hypothetical protein